MLREEYLKVKAELEMLKSSQHNTRPKSRQRQDHANTEAPGSRADPEPVDAEDSTPRLPGRVASPKRATRNAHGLY